MGVRTRVIAALVAVISACNGSSTSTPSTTAVEATTTAVPRADDGVLTIGVLAPDEGPGAAIGEGVAAGVAMAATDINGVGGVNGSLVRVIQRDEPADAASARLAAGSLLDGNVDVVIGPASSLNALAIVPQLVGAGVLTCAPTATALALESIDDSGLLVRTVPSDRLQAAALAAATERSGVTQVALVYVDDAWGNDLAELTTDALQRAGITVTASVPAAPGASDADAVATSVVAAATGQVVVIADDSAGPALVQAIAEAAEQTTRFVVNDAMRRPSADAIPYSAFLAARITGVAPLATPPDTFAAALDSTAPGTSTLFSAPAYDCITLAALAAEGAGSDNPRAIAEAVPGLTRSGTSCSNFVECRSLAADGLNFQYDGPGGALEMSDRGELSVAVFEVFGYSDGSDVALTRLTVTA
jgi:branched-chain amino acid transport system substrate-binding protein